MYLFVGFCFFVFDFYRGSDALGFSSHTTHHSPRKGSASVQEIFPRPRPARVWLFFACTSWKWKPEGFSSWLAAVNGIVYAGCECGRWRSQPHGCPCPPCLCSLSLPELPKTSLLCPDASGLKQHLAFLFWNYLAGWPDGKWVMHHAGSTPKNPFLPLKVF